MLALIVDFVPGLTVPDAADAGSRPLETSSGSTSRAASGSSTRRSRSATSLPRPEDLEVIREIIENRVNSTGVSEPVDHDPGQPTGSSSSCRACPIRTPIRDLVGQTGRLDFVPLGHTPEGRRATRSTRSSSRRCSAATELSTAAVGATARPAGASSRSSSRSTGAKLFADYTAQPHRPVLRDRPRRTGDLGASDQRARSPAATSRSRRTAPSAATR